MSTLPVKLTQVPQFVQARNPRELTRKMLQNNFKRKKRFDYQIMVMGPMLLAWFTDDLPIKFPKNNQPGVAVGETLNGS